MGEEKAKTKMGSRYISAGPGERPAYVLCAGEEGVRGPTSPGFTMTWRYFSAWGASGFENISCPIFSAGLATALAGGARGGQRYCEQAGAASARGKHAARAWGLEGKVKRGISNEFFFQEIFSSDA